MSQPDDTNPPSDNDARYDDIMRRIAAGGQSAATALALANILDGLNAFDVLEKYVNPRHRLYGVQVVRGDDSHSVVIWSPEKGYHGYRNLTVFGIWAVQLDDDAPPQIIVGEKTLPYTAIMYNAEAYHALIQRKYRLYYEDDGQPPTAPRYQIAYEGRQRLDIRRQLEAVVKEWVKARR